MPETPTALRETTAPLDDASRNKTAGAPLGLFGSIFETILFWFINLPLRLWAVDTKRWRLLRIAGVNIERCHVCGPVDLGEPGKLSQIRIGGHCYINTGLRISVSYDATVSLGEWCAIGPGVAFETAGHSLLWEEPSRGHYAKSIVVGNKCWLGARAVIVGGVTIGEGAVVAAGAVVTRDVEPFTLVGGVPARVIRKLK